MMKLNPDRLVDTYIKLGVYDKLREKIKDAVLDDSLDSKSCIDVIQKLIAFLSICDSGD